MKQFDILVTTHYDLDHVNNTPSLLAKMPAVTFVDHGPPAVKDAGTTKAFAAYEALAAKGKRMIVKPGDKIPFKGVDVLVVMSAMEALKTPVKGGGSPNPFCEATPPKTWARVNEDVSENANSIGLLFTFGKFRMLDLADLTWNRERELMCPNNPIGTVDLFMVSHHGNDISNSPALVHALRPKVAIMNNGAKKVGAARPSRPSSPRRACRPSISCTGRPTRPTTTRPTSSSPTCRTRPTASGSRFPSRTTGPSPSPTPAPGNPRPLRSKPPLTSVAGMCNYSAW